MTNKETYIARLLIRTKILECDKQAFEDLFVRIMQNLNPNFQPVKPQGSMGDKKNDGFDKTTGKYYQVYAPEDLQKKEDDALKKLEMDFNGLYQYWSKNGFVIKEYYFVLNDKYKGAYPSIHSKVQEIASTYSIKADVMLAKNLEDNFLTLPEDRINDIVGFIPDPLDIEGPEFDVMSEVIRHLISMHVSPSQETVPANPNYNEKITFNNLSSAVSDFLDAGRRQLYAVEEYFEFHSNFAKDQLRQIFSELYKQGIAMIPEGDNKNDQVFFLIRDKACPRPTLGIQNSVYILMAYYFECCDIFETPRISR